MSLLGAAGLIAIFATGCASDRYETDQGGTWNQGIGPAEQVIDTPNTVSGRRVRPAEDSVGGSAIGPDNIPYDPALERNATDVDDLDNLGDDDDLEDNVEDAMDLENDDLEDLDHTP